MKDFKNKVVVITGGGTGIGFAFAKRLGQEGAKIIIAGIREDRLVTSTNQLKELGIVADYRLCDVRKTEDLIHLEADVRSTYGRVDVLFNNAGIGGQSQSIIDSTPEEVMTIMEVNFFGAWNAIRIFGKGMREAGTPCAIYSTGSENSFFNAVKNGGAYIASKHGIHAIMKSLRMEAPEFMDVGIIIPGFVFTEIGPEQFMKYGMTTDEFVDRILPQIKDGQFYLVSHSYNLERIREQYVEIKESFDQYAPRYKGDEQYDIKLFTKKLKEAWKKKKKKE